MRDVTPPNAHNDEVDFQAIYRFLFEFVKNPVNKIKSLPDWNWQSILTLQLSLAVVSGCLAGILKPNFLRILAGLIIMPIVSTVSVLLLSLFIYYYFQFFENRTERYLKIMTMVVFASIPFYFFQILSEYFSFISVIGFAMTSLLGIVGLTENFNVERKRSQIICGGLFVLLFFAWLSGQAF